MFYEQFAKKQFQSTLPVGGATVFSFLNCQSLSISIHAPRGGSDSTVRPLSGAVMRISIHAPRGGSDPAGKQKTGSKAISIHAPRGGSDFGFSFGAIKGFEISIHAPRGGSDAIFTIRCLRILVFQSTLPVGGATFVGLTGRSFVVFQSTLPVGGATAILSSCFPCLVYFNPRSPWGERQQRCTNFRQHLWLGCQFRQAQPRKSRTKPVQKQMSSSWIPEKSRANLQGFSVHLCFALQNQGILRQIGVLAAEMLNFLFVLIPQIVETEAVLFRIHDGQKLCL